MGTRRQTIYINRMCPLLEEDKDADVSAQWSPPLLIMTMMITIQTHPEHPMTLSVFQPLEVIAQSVQLTIMDTKPSPKLT